MWDLVSTCPASSVLCRVNNLPEWVKHCAQDGAKSFCRVCIKDWNVSSIKMNQYQYVEVYLQLLQKFQWRQVAALTEDGQKYTEYISDLQDLLEKHNISVLNRKFPRDRKQSEMMQVTHEEKGLAYHCDIRAAYMLTPNRYCCPVVSCHFCFRAASSHDEEGQRYCIVKWEVSIHVTRKFFGGGEAAARAESQAANQGTILFIVHLLKLQHVAQYYNNHRDYLVNIKKENRRIIIADLYDIMARAVMCEAYHLDMTAKQGYVWFLPLWLATDWYDTDLHNNFTSEDGSAAENISCSTAEMKEVTCFSNCALSK
ncbi:hypothetical protein PR048_016078 [Dryococelus australis]|uniref:Receptor ligand binding region domain-containing protein n=1 Tax=Dryococelus australis TaxID=614101 RepID=A0ABQ9HIQ5_9NEOP|nr:hypothetical protein PR048_016078 [Dryococelus australis]